VASTRSQVVSEQCERHHVDRDHGLGVFDEVTERGVALLANGLIQRDGLSGVVLELLDQGGEPHLILRVEQRHLANLLR
jgi:hypothetical protein